MNTLLEMRKQKDEFFKRNPYSPLMPEQQALFNGLNYFPPNPSLDLELKPEPFADQAHIKMQTTKGDVRNYMRWGKVRFKVDGQDVELILYYSPGESAFFIPFMDATNGTETYSGGRYIEAERLPNGKVHLDFNLAYSPYCAYNEPELLAANTGHEARTWSCPIPPKENRLKVAIRAGEKKPTGNWCVEEHELVEDHDIE